MVYQAHRALLWGGDIDGASQLVPILNASDVPHDSLQLVALRQACAENRLTDAARIYDGVRADYADDLSIMFISHLIMSQPDAAIKALIHLDNSEGHESLADFLAYAFFDARQFPNLMSMLESQGIEPRVPREMPYRCKI